MLRTRTLLVLLKQAAVTSLAVSMIAMVLPASAQAVVRSGGTAAIASSHLWSWGFGPLGIGKSCPPARFCDRIEAQPIHGLGPGPVKQVATTYNGPVVALLDNGTVWAWGNGPLGNGGTGSSLSPVQVTALSGITQLAATTNSDGGALGNVTVYALGTDGAVRAWGQGTNGELGNGSVTDALSPVQVTGLTGVTSIVAGADTAYALKGNGTVWAWGEGASGQLGHGGTVNSDVPVQVNLTAPATEVASACGSAYALTIHRQVFAWGAGGNGALGDGSTLNAAGPRLVRRVSEATAVVASCGGGYAITGSAGTVMAWGAGNAGQIGDGHKANRPFPEAVSGLTGVASLSAAQRTTFAVRSDGTVWAWGFGRDGQLGDGLVSDSNSDVPVRVINITGPVVSVAASQFADPGLDDIYAITASGSVWSWGPSAEGATGSGGSGPDPGQMPRLPAASAVYQADGAWFASV